MEFASEGDEEPIPPKAGYQLNRGPRMKLARMAWRALVVRGRVEGTLAIPFLGPAPPFPLGSSRGASMPPGAPLVLGGLRCTLGAFRGGRELSEGSQGSPLARRVPEFFECMHHVRKRFLPIEVRVRVSSPCSMDPVASWMAGQQC